MGHKIDAGCRIREIFGVGYGMKISWQDRDALISTGVRWDSFEIGCRMQDLKSK